jgi:glycosyltransferase involved in cell wall biosynthesis
MNEEANLPAALASVAWADEIFVVDSGSTDRTQEIAEAFGAEVVQFHYTGGFPKKKNWSLRNLPFSHEWVFLLDGDERVTPELRREIEAAVHEPVADGYCVDREFIFMNRSLRCFRPNWNLRLFRHRLAQFENLGLDHLPGTGDNEIHEHVQLEGSIAFFEHALLHDDYRGITKWIDRHNGYATWEAHLYARWRREPGRIGPVAFLRLDPFRRKRALRRMWPRVPGRPLIRFFVWYFLRRGFADGREGFVFCLLMAWYELLIGIKLREIERG